MLARLLSALRRPQPKPETSHVTAARLGHARRREVEKARRDATTAQLQREIAERENLRETCFD